MPVESCRSTGSSRVLQKGVQTAFHMVVMAVRHIKLDTTDIVAQHFLPNSIAAIAITVTGDLMKWDMAILLRNCLPIIIVVTKVDHCIRCNMRDGLTHKPQSGVGIR